MMINRVLKYTCLILVFFTIGFLHLSRMNSDINDKDGLAVAMMDVGQGDSFLVMLPHKAWIVIDAGEGVDALFALSGMYPMLKKDIINTLILTHPDIDHIGGIEYLFNRYKIDCLVLTKKTLDTLNEYDIDIYNNVNVVYTDPYLINHSRCFGDDINVSFYNFKDGYTSDSNGGSIITSLMYNGYGYLFLGDATFEVLDDLNLKDIKCDLITAGHHGSKYSISKKLLSECKPKVALISVGKDNSYGHPSIEALNAYSKRDIKVLRTDEVGTVVVSFDDFMINIRKPSDIGNIFTNQSNVLTD